MVIKFTLASSTWKRKKNVTNFFFSSFSPSSSYNNRKTLSLRRYLHTPLCYFSLSCAPLYCPSFFFFLLFIHLKGKKKKTWWDKATPRELLIVESLYARRYCPTFLLRRVSLLYSYSSRATIKLTYLFFSFFTSLRQTREIITNIYTSQVTKRIIIFCSKT